MAWKRIQTDWIHDSLPYVIEWRFDEGAPWESERIDLYKIRYAEAGSRGEVLAVRFTIQAAIQYARERWRFLDERHWAAGITSVLSRPMMRAVFGIPCLRNRAVS